jgi:zinc/manganese transport system substrate-binding protein
MRLLCAAASIAALAVTGCTPSGGSEAGGRLRVVAAENTWGSIAAQLGGDRVQVTSIVSAPNADPHDYSSTPQDARAVYQASYVLVNGAGYDAWADKLVGASTAPGRRILDIARLLGRRRGENPHFWYDPGAVERVADRISSDYARLDSANSGYYRARRAAFERDLSAYRGRISAIRSRFGGTPVAATETVFEYLARALGLRLSSPPDLMRSVAEGTDPPAQGVAEFQRQLDAHQPRVLVYNRQTVTPVTEALKRRALERGIPVVGISETLQPPRARFQDWQVVQMGALERALSAPRR